ncbi:MAG TPA: MFS transporter, partial [Actinotalea sp.]|nr:MFS transporter [Actinotalea sp.]
RYKIFPVLGTASLVIGAFLLSELVATSSFGDVAWRSAVFGFGLGFCFQPLVLAVQNAVPPKDMGTATSSSLFFRQMGGTLGTAVFLSILFSTVGDKIRGEFATAVQDPQFQALLRDDAVLADPGNAPVLEALQGGGSGGLSLDDTSFLAAVDPRLAAPLLQGFSDSVSLVLLTASAVLVSAFLLTWFIPELPLRQVSGIQSRMDEAAAVAAADAAVTDVAPEREVEPPQPPGAGR